jgi:hypothetical protein
MALFFCRSLSFCGLHAAPCRRTPLNKYLTTGPLVQDNGCCLSNTSRDIRLGAARGSRGLMNQGDRNSSHIMALCYIGIPYCMGQALSMLLQSRYWFRYKRSLLVLALASFPTSGF